MPTYEFECSRCGRRDEQVHPMSGMPDSVACPCGEQAVRVISANRNSFLKNREFVFDKSKCVRSFGHGIRSPEQQHALYQDYFGRMKQMAKGRKTSKKTDIKYLGGVPGEMADSIGRHEGDPEAFIKDPVTFLKKTGMAVDE
jgi:putative FmdB family regulatory protein